MCALCYMCVYATSVFTLHVYVFMYVHMYVCCMSISRTLAPSSCQNKCVGLAPTFVNLTVKSRLVLDHFLWIRRGRGKPLSSVMAQSISLDCIKTDTSLGYTRIGGPYLLSVIPVFNCLKQEDLEFRATLGYTRSLSEKAKREKEKHNIKNGSKYKYLEMCLTSAVNKNLFSSKEGWD